MEPKPKKSIFVLNVTLWDQFIEYLVKFLCFNYLVSLFMAIGKIYGTDKIKLIIIYFSSKNSVKNITEITQTHDD